MNTDDLWTETLATGLTPIAPSAQARAQWLARLRGPERFCLFGAELVRLFGVSLADALAALRSIDDDAAWVPGALPRSRFLMTPALSAQSAIITFLPGGTLFARHAHPARELGFVLDGCVIENGVTRYRAGSVLDIPPSSEHELRVADAEDCLAVFAKR